MNRSNVDIPEHLLIERAVHGDREARRELFERFREAAYVAALRITGRHEDALDVVQDAFIKAFDGLAGFERDASFKTWLLRIATNRALDLLRARKVRLAVSLDRKDEDDQTPDPESRGADDDRPGIGLERGETAARVRKAIDALPLEQRTVFALFAEGELSYAEIAEIVGIPIGTVMSRLFHARRKLAEALADLAPSTRKKE